MIDESWQMAGIVASFMGIIISTFLVFYIKHLDKRQRKRDEVFYIATTINNIKQLKTHMINIQVISECDEPVSEGEEIEIIQRLSDYTQKNRQTIKDLISSIRLSMRRWVSLKDVERNNVEEFITTTNWILDNYLPQSDENEATQIRRRSYSYVEFYNRKNVSSNKINGLISKYT